MGQQSFIHVLASQMYTLPIGKFLGSNPCQQAAQIPIDESKKSLGRLGLGLQFPRHCRDDDRVRTKRVCAASVLHGERATSDRVL